MDSKKGSNPSKAAKKQSPGGAAQTAVPPRGQPKSVRLRKDRYPQGFGHVRFHDVNVDPPPAQPAPAPAPPPVTVKVGYSKTAGDVSTPFVLYDPAAGNKTACDVLASDVTLEDDGKAMPTDALCLQVTLDNLPRCNARWTLTVIDVTSATLPLNVNAARIYDARFILDYDPANGGIGYAVHYWVCFVDDANPPVAHLLAGIQKS